MKKSKKKLIFVKLSSKKDNTIKIIKINTLATRLKEIIGDIKLRNEIIKEVEHNGIDAGADNINVVIEYINDQQVKIIIKYTGEKLDSFSNVEQIINAILKVDESSKSLDDKMLGGKGRGLKELLCSGELIIKSIKDNKETHVEISEPNNQINKIDAGAKETFDITVLKESEKCFIPQENSVTFEIDKVDTDNIQNFEQDSLVKYIKYFTVMGMITNNFKDKSHVKMEVKGLVKGNDSYNMEQYETQESPETIEMKDVFGEIESHAKDNNYSYNYIKCFDGKIESNIGSNVLKSYLTNKEYDDLKEFFKDGVSCCLFRTIDPKFRNDIMIKAKGVQANLFGVYMAAENVVINDRFTELTKEGASKSGGNLFSQYFGYIYSNELTAAGNRNTVAGDKTYFDFKEKLNKNIMPILNKVLSYGELKKSLNKKTILKDVEPNTIQGLFAELMFILENPKRVHGWVAYQRNGEERAPHDFEFPNQTFAEVKGKLFRNDIYNNRLEISSVDQLDDPRKGELYVCFLRRYFNSSNKGKNLIDLIGMVLKKIDQEMIKKVFYGIGLYLGMDDFESYYYDVIHNRSDYDFSKMLRFVIECWKVYDVDSNLPIVRQSELREGISLNKGYSIDLSYATPKKVIQGDGQIALNI